MQAINKAISVCLNH